MIRKISDDLKRGISRRINQIEDHEEEYLLKKANLFVLLKTGNIYYFSNVNGKCVWCICSFV